MPRRSLSEDALRKLRPRSAPYPDPELPGHYFRVGKTKRISLIIARDPDGNQKWETIADHADMSLDKARDLARSKLKRLRNGHYADDTESFAAVAANHFKRHVVAKGLRGATEHQRILDRYVLPRLGARAFRSLKRSDIVRLMDEIEDGSGPRQADQCYSVISAIAHWYAARHDDYNPPLARGMKRTDPKSRRRERILNDDEIRNLWRAADEATVFGAICKFALLTGQRREKIATAKWDDISDDGLWKLSQEPREKGNPGTLLLPDMALAVIRAQPRFATNPFIFSGRGGDGPFNGHSPGKRGIDKKLPPDMPAWVLHDLRRTARSLMARAGVADRVAEQVLGHVIGGIEGTYNRHRYDDEKAAALRALADLLDRILHPQENVIQLRPSG